MPLTQEQIVALNKNVLKISLKDIMNFIANGDVKYPADFPVFTTPKKYIPDLTPYQQTQLDQRKSLIEKDLESLPNPAEQAEWEAVKLEDMASTDIAVLMALKSRLEAYIRYWDTLRPNGNHVDEALEKLRLVEEKIRSLPDPEEQAEWKAIQDRLADRMSDDLATLRSLLKQVNDYIDHWSAVRPKQNHVDEAMELAHALREKIKEIMAAEEARDWEALYSYIQKRPSTKDLLAFLEKYPETTYRQKIDDDVWANVLETTDVISAAKEYIRVFPNGSHKSEANDVSQEHDEWSKVKDSADPIMVHDYMIRHPHSVFIGAAQALLSQLKAWELDKMRENCSAYPVGTFNALRQEGIFTDDELIKAEVATKDSLRILDNYMKVQAALPDILTAVASCKQECADKRTDVYLFGIPSTGKSCVLMGLIDSPKLDIDLASAGGPYAKALMAYRKAGATIGSTPSDLAVTIQATYTDKRDKEHELNLIEMAGEDFACKLADNPEGTVSFADMGNGVPQLLANGNRKIFFLVVDPTAQVVAFKRKIRVYNDDGTPATGAFGNPLYDEVPINIDQNITLKTMLSLMAHPDNRDIMRKVEAINIIVTKADCFGERGLRQEKAVEHFLSLYDESFVRPLTKLCKKFGINATGRKETDGRPKLYTFSLGDFYVGDIYKYDATDANELVEVLANYSDARRSAGGGSLFSKLSNFFDS